MWIAPRNIVVQAILVNVILVVEIKDVDTIICQIGIGILLVILDILTHT